MKRLILFLLLATALATGQTTSFYTDRAVGTFPVGSGTAKITALIPIQFGPVRVCQLPLTQAQPCLPLANITDINNNPISNAIGGGFGQLSTDVVGRFTFGCQVNLNYQIQVAPASSNVPQLNYPITCPGTGATPAFTTLTAGQIDNEIYVDGIKYPFTQAGVQQAFTDACNASLFPTGSTTVHIGAANIALHNQANQLLLVTCPLLISGAGGLSGTNFVVDAGIASTVPVIRYQATGNTNHFHIQNVTLIAASITTAGDGLLFDGQNIQANTPTFIEVGPNFNIGTVSSFNGRAINTNLSGVGSSAALLWQIHDSSLSGGVKLVNTADATSIRNNSFSCATTSTNANIEMTPIAGAAEQEIHGNWAGSGCPGGAVILHSGGQINIEWNQFEQTTASTEANSAMIDLMGDVAPINNVRIIHNNLNSHNNATNMIRVDKATNTHIEDNIPTSSSATGVFILLTANATLTRFPWNDTTQLTGGAVALSNASATTTFSIQGADGTEGTPAVSSANFPGYGIYFRNTVVEISEAGSAIFQASPNGQTVGQNGGTPCTLFANGSVRTTVPDSGMCRTAAGVISSGQGTPGNSTGGWKGGSFLLTNMFASATAPTIAAAGCGGAAASIPNNNGTAAFEVNVGTTPGSACTITMPTAAHGWACSAVDVTTNSTSVFLQKQSPAASQTTTQIVITNFNDVAVATAFTASDVMRVLCNGY